MNACLGDSSAKTSVHLGTAGVCGRGAGVQTGKDTEPPLALGVPGSTRKEGVDFPCETLELRRGGKPWAEGGQPGLAAS